MSGRSVNASALRAGLTVLRVLDEPAGRGNLVAETVGFRPVLRLAGLGALVQERLNLGGDLDSLLLIAEEDDAEHLVHALEDIDNGIRRF